MGCLHDALILASYFQFPVESSPFASLLEKEKLCQYRIGEQILGVKAKSIEFQVHNYMANSKEQKSCKFRISIYFGFFGDVHFRYFGI